MKVITKEKLMERLNITQDPRLFGFLAGIITECEEIDTLTETTSDSETYVYFISYAHKYGFGNLNMPSAYRLDSIERLRDIEEYLRTEYSVQDPVILNLKRLKI